MEAPGVASRTLSGARDGRSALPGAHDCFLAAATGCVGIASEVLVHLGDVEAHGAAVPIRAQDSAAVVDEDLQPAVEELDFNCIERIGLQRERIHGRKLPPALRREVEMGL